MGGHFPVFLTFPLVGVFYIWVPFGFIFNEWEKDKELVFYMCSFRTVTWRASRHGREVGDRPCFR